MNYNIFTPYALEIRNFVLNTSLHNTYQKNHNHSYFIFSISSMTHQITFLYLFIHFWNYKEHRRSNPSTSLLSSTTLQVSVTIISHQDNWRRLSTALAFFFSPPYNQSDLFKNVFLIHPTSSHPIHLPTSSIPQETHLNPLRCLPTMFMKQLKFLNSPCKALQNLVPMRSPSSSQTALTLTPKLGLIDHL